MAVMRPDMRYTYEDYASWSDEARYELIDGVPCMMAPASSRGHHDVSGALFNQLFNFLAGKSCKVYHAPFDVRLNAADDTVVQPDLVVVCDRSKLDDKGCNGAPDMVAEITSPSTASRDIVLKFNKYLQAGVREYWIVDPDSKTVSANILDGGRYYVTTYAESDTAPVQVLEGCAIDLKEVFAQ